MIRRFSLQALASALAGAGLGLFVWMGISVALLQANSGNLVALRSLQHTGLVIAGLLTLASLVNLRACPTASGIKWRQITAGALVLTLASAVAVLILLSLRTPTPGWTALCAALLSIGAIATTLGPYGRDGITPSSRSPPAALRLSARETDGVATMTTAAQDRETS